MELQRASNQINVQKMEDTADEETPRDFIRQNRDSIEEIVQKRKALLKEEKSKLEVLRDHRNKSEKRLQM